MLIFGPPNIDKLKSRLDIKGLIKALDYTKNATLREKAVEALGELRADAATEPLISLLEDENCGYKPQVVSALGKIKAESAVPVLINRITENGTAVSDTELSALQNIGPPAAVPLLGVLRENAQDAKQALTLIKTLEGIGGSEIADGFLDLVSARFPSLILHLAEALVRLEDERAIPRLVDALKASHGESWSAQVAAVLKQMGWCPSDESEKAVVYLAEREWEELAKLGAPAVSLVSNFMTTGQASEIQKAAETLGQIGDERAVEPLAALLSHKRPEIAVTAARALGEIGSGQSVEMLLQNAVDSKSSPIQAEAEKSLVKIGASAVCPLIDQLNSSDARERKTAVRILGEIGDERALNFLISAQDDPTLQPELYNALCQLGWSPPDSEE
ncbi:MAG: HEAT repeat domain-containing protein [Candidatus Aminicenantaceae bacterium]